MEGVWISRNNTPVQTPHCSRPASINQVDEVIPLPQKSISTSKRPITATSGSTAVNHTLQAVPDTVGPQSSRVPMGEASSRSNSNMKDTQRDPRMDSEEPGTSRRTATSRPPTAWRGDLARGVDNSSSQGHSRNLSSPTIYGGNRSISSESVYSQRTNGPETTLDALEACRVRQAETGQLFPRSARSGWSETSSPNLTDTDELPNDGRRPESAHAQHFHNNGAVDEPNHCVSSSGADSSQDREDFGAGEGCQRSHGHSLPRGNDDVEPMISSTGISHMNTTMRKVNPDFEILPAGTHTAAVPVTEWGSSEEKSSRRLSSESTRNKLQKRHRSGSSTRAQPRLSSESTRSKERNKLQKRRGSVSSTRDQP